MPLPTGTTTRASLTDLVKYFLYLGTFGFGGPVALAGFMHRDHVEQRRWVDEDEYPRSATSSVVSSAQTRSGWPSWCRRS